MKVVSSILLVFVSLGSLCAQQYRKQVLEGNKQYTAEKFDEAEVAYRRALESDEDSRVEARFNLGNSLFRQERFDEALESYQQSLAEAPNKDIEARALHNIGNTFLRKQDYQKAIEAYQKSLLRKPNDEETRYNLAKAKKLLKIK